MTDRSGRVEKQEQGSQASPSRCTIQCKISLASDAGEEDSINSGRRMLVKDNVRLGVGPS